MNVTIGDLAETIRGVTYEKAEARSSPREGYSPLIRATNIENGGLVLDSFVYVPDIVIRGDQRLRVGDIVLAASSGSLSVVGKAALVRSQGVGTFGAFCYVVRPQSDRVVPDYLAYFMQTSNYRSRVSALAAGVNINNLRREHIEDIELPYCALAEQQRIVEAVDSYFTRLDDAVGSLERVQAKLKAYRASVLKAAVEGRLVPTEAELAQSEGRDYEPANELLSRTEAPPRPNRWNSRSGDVLLGHAALAVGNPRTALPEGWAWSPLVNVARMESGHTPSRNHAEWWDGDVSWIGIVDARAHDGGTIYDTIQHTNEAGLAHSAARLLPKGTVCVSRTASVGYVVVMGNPMATSQDFVNWIPTIAVSSDWLRIVFGADRDALRRFGKGSVHKTIYFPEWLSVHVAIPPLAEQARIVEEVDHLLSVSGALELTAEADLKRSWRLRQAVLKWAFEGKLVEQDQTDEPANKLLARIEAERAEADSTKKSGRRRAKGAA